MFALDEEALVENDELNELMSLSSEPPALLTDFISEDLEDDGLMEDGKEDIEPLKKPLELSEEDMPLMEDGLLNSPADEKSMPADSPDMLGMPP